MEAKEEEKKKGFFDIRIISTITVYEEDKSEFVSLKSKQEFMDKTTYSHADFFRRMLTKFNEDGKTKEEVKKNGGKK